MTSIGRPRWRTPAAIWMMQPGFGATTISAPVAATLSIFSSSTRSDSSGWVRL